MRFGTSSVGKCLMFHLTLILVAFVTAGVATYIGVSKLTTQVARVDIAGRQRMLAQRFAKEALHDALAVDQVGGAEPNRSWSKTRELFETSQAALIEGGQVYRDLAMRETANLAPEGNVQVRALLERAFEAWNRMVQAAETLVASSRTAPPDQKALEELWGATRDCVAAQNAAVAQMSAASQRTAHILYGLQFVLILAGLILLGTVSWRLRQRLCIPLAEATKLAEQAAQGNLTERCQVRSTDEVGRLTDALNRMCAELSRVVGRVRSGAAKLAQAAGTLAHTADELAEEASSTSSGANLVTSATEQIRATVVDLTSSAEGLSDSVRAIASAVEEMTATLSQTADHANQSRSVAEQTAASVQNSERSIAELRNAAEEIGQIVGTIKEIADQTNLLALNASIEAARAGESGRGFTVVANEVKDLAKQTAEATVDISERIQTMQQRVVTVSEAIRTINENVQRVLESSRSIAAVVEEQRAAIQEVARSVTGASDAADVVSSSVSTVSVALDDIARQVTEMERSARSLALGAQETRATGLGISELAVELEQLMAPFQVAAAELSDATADRSRAVEPQKEDERSLLSVS